MWINDVKLQCTTAEVHHSWLMDAVHQYQYQHVVIKTKPAIL